MAADKSYSDVVRTTRRPKATRPTIGLPSYPSIKTELRELRSWFVIFFVALVVASISFAKGSPVDAVGIFVALVILGYGYVMGLGSWLMILAERRPKSRILHGWPSAIIAIAVLGSSAFMVYTWSTSTYRQILHGILSRQGVVVDAKITNTTLYNNAYYTGGDVVDEFDKASSAVVHLQLPNGQKTILTLYRSPKGHSAAARRRDAFLFLELNDRTVRVRYWRSSPWLVEPEVDFTPVTDQEGCALLYKFNGTKCSAAGHVEQ